jgi:hypothetical protein
MPLSGMGLFLPMATPRYRMKEKRMAVNPAVKGTVINQEYQMSRITFRFKALIPLAIPTPITAPTKVWVVEMGSPKREHTRTVVAHPNSAEKPRDGLISVMDFIKVYLLV